MSRKSEILPLWLAMGLGPDSVLDRTSYTRAESDHVASYPAAAK